MFVRKKRNKSGIVSIQIQKTVGRKSVFVKTIGSSSDLATIEKLVLQGEAELINLTRQPVINFQIEQELTFVEKVFQSITDWKLVGPEMVIGKIFNEVGFGAIKDDLFRYLVITRLVYPVSKLKTVDYLEKYNGVTLSVDALYRYLDKVHKYQVRQIQDIGYRHAVRVTGGKIQVVFYDVTTLYFEAEDEDDLRKMGFSKDGKSQQPQIVLGLLVNETGFPLAYEIFEGNKSEGHTFLPVISAFKAKYGFTQLTVVADAGLMSSSNLAELTAQHYEFIIGARIKSETDLLKNKILALGLEDGKSTELERQAGQRLVISYSAARAKKDGHNRKRGLEKLEKSLAAGRLTKKNINNKG